MLYRVGQTSQWLCKTKTLTFMLGFYKEDHLQQKTRQRTKQGHRAVTKRTIVNRRQNREQNRDFDIEQ